jgi:imidazolonepropionase-like amidohydrolase
LVTSYLFHGGRLLDPRRETLVEGAHVLVEDDRIKEVADRPIGAATATRVDLRGRTLMPGLIDAHVHILLPEVNLHFLDGVPLTLLAAKGSVSARAMLMRGFTSVRDTGGADYGMKAAIEGRLFEGPRLFISGMPISQTGGHGDFRKRTQTGFECACCSGLAYAARVADGVPEVLRAVRDELRKGADHIKLMVSGGVASPNDPLDSLQFTVEEIRAAVGEARSWKRYVCAHAYGADAIARAVECGVRSIEHGNLIRETAAKAIKDAEAFLVPTMVTYEAIYREGKRYGIGDHQIAKIDMARQQSIQGLTYAYKAGCKIGSGSDLLGDMATQRAVEFELKGQVMKPMEVLLSATKVNAELFRMSHKIGSVEPNKYADLIVLEGNPLKNLRAFQNQDNLKVIMKDGRVYKQTL